MDDELSNEMTGPNEECGLSGRRLFLQSLGKWSGAAIAAAVFGGVWLAAPPDVDAGAWINRRGYGGGGWINGRGYGGGGAWVNRRGYGGGGSWINRW